MQVTQCDVCNETGASKATHRIEADDARFSVAIYLEPKEKGLDTCPGCWWKLVRQALKEPA
ncbi:hypothetical protein LCGC14_1346210 [marine sediment metagenome]|uniref:Uncharacterized protein n=1 Tax=marine sediment metagenome TaxID=412755 RepID=A0A0F9MT43_9ZZZZ